MITLFIKCFIGGGWLAVQEKTNRLLDTDLCKNINFINYVLKYQIIRNTYYREYVQTLVCVFLKTKYLWVHYELLINSQLKPTQLNPIE